MYFRTLLLLRTLPLLLLKQTFGILLSFIAEVVEKAKEGYESNVSDLEEDDNVIYQTLGGDTSSSASLSENSGER